MAAAQFSRKRLDLQHIAAVHDPAIALLQALLQPRQAEAGLVQGKLQVHRRSGQSPIQVGRQGQAACKIVDPGDQGIEHFKGDVAFGGHIHPPPQHPLTIDREPSLLEQIEVDIINGQFLISKTDPHPAGANQLLIFKANRYL